MTKNTPDTNYHVCQRHAEPQYILSIKINPVYSTVSTDTEWVKS